MLDHVSMAAIGEIPFPRDPISQELLVGRNSPLLGGECRAQAVHESEDDLAKERSRAVLCLSNHDCHFMF